MADEQLAACAHLRVECRKVDAGEMMVQATEQFPGGLRRLVTDEWHCVGCNYTFVPFHALTQTRHAFDVQIKVSGGKIVTVSTRCIVFGRWIDSSCCASGKRNGKGT